MVGIAFGSLYHNINLKLYQPYIVLSFVLINTIMYYNFKTKFFIRNILHKHIWSTMTLAVYGIMINNIQTEMFRDFHFATEQTNIIVSIIYFFLVNITGYYFKSETALTGINLLFLFIPLRRVWQINLYMYICFSTIAVVIMYSKCKQSSLIYSSVHKKPVNRYFMYLRINDLIILGGFIQLYFEYYTNIYTPDIEALSKIREFIKEEKKQFIDNNVYKIDEKELESFIESN